MCKAVRRQNTRGAAAGWTAFDDCPARVTLLARSMLLGTSRGVWEALPFSTSFATALACYQEKQQKVRQ